MTMSNVLFIMYFSLLLFGIAPDNLIELGLWSRDLGIPLSSMQVCCKFFLIRFYLSILIENKCFSGYFVDPKDFLSSIDL